MFARPGFQLRTGAQFTSREPRPLIWSPRLKIAGVSRDSVGANLGACTMHLHRTVDDARMDVATSDGSGNYSVYNIGIGELYYVVAYLPGSPDRAGTTVNTLQGVPV